VSLPLSLPPRGVVRFVDNAHAEVPMDLGGVDLPGADLLGAARTLLARHPEAGAHPARLVRVAGLGADTWVLDETSQVTGSFKVRGALLALERLLATGVREVIAASAGNHGAGVAHAAKVLGMKATIVVPRGTPEKKLSNIRGAGATLVVHDVAGYDAAEAFAMEWSARDGIPFLSAYDDVAVVAGNGASLGYEVLDLAAAHPLEGATVLVPFGGGGLATGLATVLGPRGFRVLGVESEVSPAMALSLERDAAQTTLEPEGETWAEGLEGGIATAAFARARAVVDGIYVVSEPKVRAAMGWLHRAGITCEGSAALAILPVAAVRAAFPGPIVVLLTGRNVDAARLVG